MNGREDEWSRRLLTTRDIATGGRRHVKVQEDGRGKARSCAQVLTARCKIDGRELQADVAQSLLEFPSRFRCPKILASFRPDFVVRKLGYGIIHTIHI